MIAIDDHTLKLGFDMTAVNKGFEDIERRFSKLKNRFDSTDTKPPRPARPPSSAISQGERDRGLSNLDATTLKAKQQIEALKKVGSKEAQSKIMALEAAVKRLKVAEDSLNKSTKTTDKSFIHYKKTLRDTKNQVNSVSKSTNVLARKFTTAKFAADGLTSSLKNLGRSWVSVFAVIGGINYLKNTAQDMENIGVASLLASGSAKKSAKDLKFVADLTQDLGLSYKDTAEAYARFSVAARSSGVSAEKTEEVFTNISNALAGSATNAESAKLAFLGFRQMMSGSVVQAQEINQIVDQAPAFYGAASKALVQMGYDISTVANDGKKSFKETFKVAGVDAKRFVELSSSIMSQQAKDTGALAKFRQSITAEETRMVNALQVAVEGMANAGLEDLFKNTFKGIEQVITAVAPALEMLSAGLGLLAKAVAFPFEMIDKLGMALGMDEGEGLQMAIRGVLTLLMVRFVPALVATTKTLWGVVTGSFAAASSLLGVGTGAKGASKGVAGLTTSVRTLMRALWPLLAVELAINIFDSENRKNYDDLVEATKTFTEEQAKVNEELEKSQGFYNLWLRAGLLIKGTFNDIIGQIKQAIGYFQIFTNLSFADMGKTLVKKLEIFAPKASDDPLTPFDKALSKSTTEGERRAREIIGGATVTNHYNINGDTEVMRATIEEGMARYVPEYMQTVYSGGG